MRRPAARRASPSRAGVRRVQRDNRCRGPDRRRGNRTSRDSAVIGAPRGPFCMMGVCFDCLVEIDGLPNRQACMTRRSATAWTCAASAARHEVQRMTQLSIVVVIGAGPAGHGRRDREPRGRPVRRPCSTSSPRPRRPDLPGDRDGRRRAAWRSSAPDYAEGRELAAGFRASGAGYLPGAVGLEHRHATLGIDYSSQAALAPAARPARSSSATGAHRAADADARLDPAGRHHGRRAADPAEGPGVVGRGCRPGRLRSAALADRRADDRRRLRRRGRSSRPCRGAARGRRRRTCCGAARRWRTSPRALAMMREVKRAGVPIHRDATELRRSRATSSARSAVSFTRRRAAGIASRRRAVALHQGVVPNQQITRLLRCDHRWNASQRCFRAGARRLGETSVAECLRRRRRRRHRRCRGRRRCRAGWRRLRIAAAGKAADDGVAALQAPTARGTLSSPRRCSRRSTRPSPRGPGTGRRHVVCRCEEVTAGAVREAVDLGAPGSEPGQIRSCAAAWAPARAGCAASPSPRSSPRARGEPPAGGRLLPHPAAAEAAAAGRARRLRRQRERTGRDGTVTRHAARRPTCVVVGGGIHGCSAALHAALRGLSVIVLEKDTVAPPCLGRECRRRAAARPASMPRSRSRSVRCRSGTGIEDLLDDDCGFQTRAADQGGRDRGRAGDADGARRRGPLAGLRARSHPRPGAAARACCRPLRRIASAASPASTTASPCPTARPSPSSARRSRSACASAKNAAAQSRRRADGDFGSHRRSRRLHARATCSTAPAPGPGAVGGQLGEQAPVEAIAPMMIVTAACRVSAMRWSVPPGGRCPSSRCRTAPSSSAAAGAAAPIRETNVVRDPVFGELRLTAKTAIAVFPIMALDHHRRSWSGIEGRMPDDIPVIGAVADGGKRLSTPSAFPPMASRWGRASARSWPNSSPPARPTRRSQPFCIGRFRR